MDYINGAERLTSIASLICRTEPNKKNNEELKTKNGDAQKKRSGCEVRGVSPAEAGSLWWERYVKEVGLEPGVKERGS